MAEARVLVAGEAGGEALVLGEPLSFWGGTDPETGIVTDRRHPQHGESLRGRIVVMPAGRGSSSSSSVLAESIRLGSAPAAILLHEPDGIVALGSLVARELYGEICPVVVLGAAQLAGLSTGDRVWLAADGEVSVSSRGRPDAPR